MNRFIASHPRYAKKVEKGKSKYIHGSINSFGGQMSHGKLEAMALRREQVLCHVFCFGGFGVNHDGLFGIEFRARRA